jgi:neutral ceramidase
MLRVGFASVDITPPIGSEIPGGFEKRYNVGVHDPLHARAMLLEDERIRLAIVGVDCLSLKHSTVQQARQLADAWGVDKATILACASHTHSGGPVATVFGSDSDPEYLRFLGRRIAQAVVLANRAKVPARLGIGVGHEETVAFNRRFWMKDGKQTTHPGKGNPDIVRVAGPIDPQVGVVGAWSMDGRYLGCLVNYTCHCTVMNGLEVSADYPYYLDATIRAVMGWESVTIFMNGAYGDVTQVSNTIVREEEFGERWARRIGTVLGAEALKVLATMEPKAELSLQATFEQVILQPREVPTESLAAAKALLETKGPWNNERRWARELVLLEAMNREEPAIPAEVQVLAVGDVAFVGIPGEYFCQFGLEIKEQSPFSYTFIAGTANGCVGYIPTAEAMGPNGGGYEPRLCRSSKLAPNAGYLLQRTALKLLNRLKHVHC